MMLFAAIAGTALALAQEPAPMLRFALCDRDGGNCAESAAFDREAFDEAFSPRRAPYPEPAGVTLEDLRRARAMDAAMAEIAAREELQPRLQPLFQPEPEPAPAASELSRWLKGSMLVVVPEALGLWREYLTEPSSRDNWGIHTWFHAIGTLGPDPDRFSDFVKHPYKDGLACVILLNEGSSARACYAFSILHAFLWKYLGEAQYSYPISLPDLATPILGSGLATGWVMRKATDEIQSHVRYPWLRAVLIAIANPPYWPERLFGMVPLGR